MAARRYAVGDLQGCLPALRQLVDEHVVPRGGEWCLWFVGDLVNRGPASVETLRYVRSLGDRARVVLGNHDFYLLALAAGMPAKGDDRENLHEVLEAPDAPALIDWLRHQPFMYAEDGFAMVHAGLLPQWTVEEALSLAGEVEAALRGPDWQRFLLDLWGNQPDCWDAGLAGMARMRLVVNAMARMRFITRDGRVDTRQKGPPEAAPDGLLPWFAVESPAWATHTILCGHWSALGFRDMGRVIALDSGCVWGGCLTAVCLEDRAVLQVSCPRYAAGSD